MTKNQKTQLKMDKGLKRHFSREGIQRPTSLRKDALRHQSLGSCKSKLQRDTTSHPLGELNQQTGVTRVGKVVEEM